MSTFAVPTANSPAWVLFLLSSSTRHTGRVNISSCGAAVVASWLVIFGAPIAIGVTAQGVQGRGRDEDFSSPPAQIPASAANAPGSSLGSNVGGAHGLKPRALRRTA